MGTLSVHFRQEQAFDQEHLRLLSLIAGQTALACERARQAQQLQDDAHVLTATQAMLEELGYRVLVATSGVEALQLFDGHRDEIALVLTDVIMPAMSGLTLIQALRERGSDVPIVAMTGYPVKDLRQRMSGVEADAVQAWVRKPFNAGELAQVLGTVLRGDAG